MLVGWHLCSRPRGEVSNIHSSVIVGWHWQERYGRLGECGRDLLHLSFGQRDTQGLPQRIRDPKASQWPFPCKSTSLEAAGLCRGSSVKKPRCSCLPPLPHKKDSDVKLTQSGH